jgi:hypothetical protein
MQVHIKFHKNFLFFFTGNTAGRDVAQLQENWVEGEFNSLHYFNNKCCHVSASRFELNRTKDGIEIFVHLAIMQKFLIFNADYAF